VTEKLGKPSWKAISKYDSEYKLGLNTWASAEAQVAALADDIAYNNHDVDDGVEAGLFTLDELMDVPLIGPILAAVRSERPDLDLRLTRLEAVRRMIGAMVDDVMGETLQRAAATGVQSADDVRNLDHALVAFSPDMAEDLARLRQFLHARMYRHWRSIGRAARRAAFWPRCSACSWPSPTSCRRNGSPGRRTATRPAAPAWSATTSRA
jgi:dGTPase